LFTISTRVSETVSFPSPVKKFRGYYDLRGKRYTPLCYGECESRMQVRWAEEILKEIDQKWPGAAQWSDR